MSIAWILINNFFEQLHRPDFWTLVFEKNFYEYVEINVLFKWNVQEIICSDMNSYSP